MKRRAGQTSVDNGYKKIESYEIETKDSNCLMIMKRFAENVRGLQSTLRRAIVICDDFDSNIL